MTRDASSRKASGGARSIGAPLGLLVSWSILTMGALVVPSIAAGQAFTWSGGVDVTNGDYYFSERTTAAWLSNGLVFRQGALWVDASLPLLAQNSDAVTRVAGLPIPTGGSRSGDVAGRGDGTGSGPGSGSGSQDPTAGSRRTIEIEEPGSLELTVGDPLFGAGIDVAPAGSAVRSLRAGVSAKAPVRDVESGIGTGEWDFGVGGGASVAAGSLLILVDATWWSLGDLPDLELKDMLAYSAALGGLFGDRGSVGWSLSLSGSTAMIEDVEAPVSAGGNVLFWSDGGSSFQVGLRFGLTESAADVAGSIGWAVPLTR